MSKPLSSTELRLENIALRSTNKVTDLIREFQNSTLSNEEFIHTLDTLHCKKLFSHEDWGRLFHLLDLNGSDDLVIELSKRVRPRTLSTPILNKIIFAITKANISLEVKEFSLEQITKSSLSKHTSQSTLNLIAYVAQNPFISEEISRTLLQRINAILYTQTSTHKSWRTISSRIIDHLQIYTQSYSTSRGFDENSSPFTQDTNSSSKTEEPETITMESFGKIIVNIANTLANIYCVGGALALCSFAIHYFFNHTL